MVQMRPVGIAVGRAIPGGDRHGDIHDGMGAPAEGHAAADERRQPILPIVINAFEKKTDLEKSWERDQLAYGMLLFGSFIHIAAVTSSMANDQSQLTRVLITFGTLWCLLAMGFLLHLHAKDSSHLQKYTSLAPRLFLVALSYLVVLHISYSIPNKQAGRLVWKRCFRYRTSTSPIEDVDPHVSSWSLLNRFVFDRDESGAFIFRPTRLRASELNR
uniref:Uncharacterized protein n=1 Tax=Oryza punctata TaxID=4537 RepID=A0A0E0LHL4_ORYPU